MGFSTQLPIWRGSNDKCAQCITSCGLLLFRISVIQPQQEKGKKRHEDISPKYAARISGFKIMGNYHLINDVLQQPPIKKQQAQ